MTSKTSKEATRRASADQIRNAAIVRGVIGVAALYRVINGVHQIIARGKVYIGRTLDEAIDVAMRGSTKDE